MRRVIGFLGSLGVGVMLTAAGLAFDVGTLFYGGIVIFAAMAALWLWSWGKPIPEPALPSGPPAKSGTAPNDPKAKAIDALATARTSAMMARRTRNDETCRRACHEMEAALLSTKREFGIGGLTVSGEGRYKDVLEGYIAYADAILPHLREGHIEEARKRSASFTF